VTGLCPADQCCRGSLGPGLLLDWALIKIFAVASRLDTDSTRAMIESLIAGQRHPKAPADLAIGRMRPKRGHVGVVPGLDPAGFYGPRGSRVSLD
jgi:hypothetical protein